MQPRKTLLGLVRPTIRNDRELRWFVLRTSAACIALALSIDILNQLTFFLSWVAAIRSWAITVVAAGGIAAPVLFLMGRAYLELYRAGQDLIVLSRTDPLTGLLNRRALFESEALAPTVMALVIVDIDRFKRINDAHGHLVGDEVIRAVGTMLSRTFGDASCIGRIGGEEFAALSSDPDPQAFKTRVEALRDGVAAMSVICRGATVRVTISAGLATRAQGESFEELYAAADRALYIAKAAGRNRIVLASDLPMPLPPQPGTSAAAPSALGAERKQAAG